MIQNYGEGIFMFLVRLLLVIILLISFSLVSPQSTIVHAGSDIELSRGATVYVAIYSNIFSGSKGQSFNLAGMLSIRNTDPKHPITILTVDYYDSDGKLLASHLKEPRVLKPLQSVHHQIQERDTSGGPGANFIVKWSADHKVNKPVIEALMTSLLGATGLSFRTEGQEITEHQ